MDLGKVETEYFRYLAGGRAHVPISDDDLVVLLGKILSKEDGINIAIEILMMRFHESKDPAKYSASLAIFARDVLCRYEFSRDRVRHDSNDHELSQIALVGLYGDAGGPAAVELCRHLVQAIVEHHIYVMDYPTLISSISKMQPFVFLDAFIGSDQIRAYRLMRMFIEDFEHRENPIDHIPDDVIISWCENDPPVRYPLIAASIKLFKEEGGILTWKPILSRVLDRAPELEPVFNGIAGIMEPHSWSGSRADIMDRRSELYKELFEHDRAEIEIGALARTKYRELQKRVTEELKSEGKMFRTQFESFE